jgi:uncharacterized membrane protein
MQALTFQGATLSFRVEVSPVVKEFHVGEVFGQSFSVVRANFIPFMVMVGLIQLPAIAYAIYVTQEKAAEFASGNIQGLGASYWILTFLNMFLGALSYGALVFGVLQHLRGQRASIGECISIGFSKLLAVLGVSIVYGILYILGLILLVIPGLIVICTFYVAIPAAVVERGGVGDALSRSRELTRGNRWRVFGVLILMFLVQMVAGLIVFIGYGFSMEISVSRQVVASLIGVFFTAWRASAAAVSYYHLRSVKESVDVDDVASVFD